MSKRNDGGPAFPTMNSLQTYLGLTKRDWFAGQAIIALAAEAIRVEVSMEDATAAMAKASYLIANAMLKERAK